MPLASRGAVYWAVFSFHPFGKLSRHPFDKLSRLASFSRHPVWQAYDHLVYWKRLLVCTREYIRRPHYDGCIKLSSLPIIIFMLNMSCTAIAYMYTLFTRQLEFFIIFLSESCLWRIPCCNSFLYRGAIHSMPRWLVPAVFFYQRSAHAFIPSLELDAVCSPIRGIRSFNLAPLLNLECT